MAASATFALKAGVWFRRGRLDMVSPDSQAIGCLLSGRNSTYRPVQNSGTGSHLNMTADIGEPDSPGPDRGKRGVMRREPLTRNTGENSESHKPVHETTTDS